MSELVIRLRNCGFYARHGVRAEEASLGQRFFVDVELAVDPGAALESDEVHETVDYGEVFELVEQVVTGRRFQLIEALAFAIGREIMDRFARVERAAVTVRKPGVPIPGILDCAEVTVSLP